MRKRIVVNVNEADRRRLAAIVADGNSPQKHVWRARIVLLTADGREARAGIGDWIEFYNEGRLHQTLGDRAPMAVWRASIGELDRSAVDMTLRWDDADASPTCPQRQHQQPERRIAAWR